jgi:hypothetical protein
MIRTVMVLTAGLVLCTALARAQDEKPAKTTIEVIALSVNKKLSDKDLSWFSSTGMTFKLQHPGKQILGVDTSSKITDFQDDKKTSLIGTGFFRPSFYGGQTSKDRSSILISLSSGVNPAKGASKVTLKGSVVLRCGLDEKTTEAKEVEFKLPKKDDPEIKIDDFVLKVTAERGFGFNSGAAFTLTTEKPGIKSVTVKDEDGNAVEVSTGYSYQEFNTKKMVYNFTLGKQVKKGKLTVTYYNKEEKVTVPVDFSVGLGL